MKINLLLIVALILNLLIIGSVSLVFSKIKNKKEIFKYYTYVQSLLALVVSIILIICFIIGEIPGYVRGLRYIVTCGLVFTMIIYNFFLARNSNNLMRDEDYIGNFKAKWVNFILHIFCPIISLISFIFFERDIIVEDGIWTILVVLPSALYFIFNIIISSKLPYDFSTKKSNKVIDKLIFVLIPMLFIVVTFIIWNIK